MKNKFIIITFLFSVLFCGNAAASIVSEKDSGKDTLKTDIRIPIEGYGIEISVDDTLTDDFLDSIDIKKKREINDYTMIGVQYGVGLSQVMWNPTKKQDMMIIPVNFGFTYTRYGKMFGYMPYFGFQAGLFYAREGYRFEYNEDTEHIDTIEGAESAVLDVIELPVMAHMHIDFWKMKMMFNLGCYAGYRLSIHRDPGRTGNVAPELLNSFKSTDRRADYGIKGGVGFGLVLDPIEIHIQGMYKHSLSNLYQPDYESRYFYKYAYPSNIIISAGVHFQLTKRTGKTKSQLKKAAREMVFNTKSDAENTDFSR